MKAEQLVDWYVRKAVAIGSHEALAFNELADPEDPAASHRVGARLCQRDSPIRLAMSIVVFDGVLATEMHGEVVHPGLIVEEVVADHIALIAEADDKVAHVEVRVVLHDVPENRPTTDHHHRLGAILGLLAQTRSKATSEKNCFHGTDATEIGGVHTLPKINSRYSLPWDQPRGWWVI